MAPEMSDKLQAIMPGQSRTRVIAKSAGAGYIPWGLSDVILIMGGILGARIL